MRLSIGGVIVRRFTEILLTNAALSAFVTFLHIAQALVSENALFIALTLSTVIFTLINVRISRQYYFNLKDKKIYFLTSIFAYLLFADLCLFVNIFCPKELFTWFFAITKFAKYTYLQTSTFISILIFHGIGLASIILAPIGMEWVFSKDDMILTGDEGIE